MVAQGRPKKPGPPGPPGVPGYNGRPGATRGDQGRPVAPLLGTRSSYASSARQRSPAVAHGRPWSPIGTRECQGVPGGSGFNGRPWATRGDQGRPVAPLLGTRSSYASSARQRSPMVAHGRPWSPIGTRECQGVPGGSGFNGRPWATSGDPLSRSSVEVNCRSKHRFFNLTPQDCIFRSRNQRLRRGLGWVFG